MDVDVSTPIEATAVADLAARLPEGTVVTEPATADRYRYDSASFCAAAAGRIDAYYELHLNPWDHAAGGLVAAEAGLLVTGLPGTPFAEPMGIVAAPSIAGDFVRLIADLH